jgi:hypothetical protein
MAAVNNRYNVTYPQKDDNENGRLYRMFNNVLETVSGGNSAKFLSGFLNQRYRTQLKKDLIEDLKVPVGESVIIQNARRCLVDCKEIATANDPSVNAVRLNVVKMLCGVVSKKTMVGDWDAVSGTPFAFVNRLCFIIVLVRWYLHQGRCP